MSSTPAPARHALPLPAKRYFSGPEVSALCGVQPHVLRQWEQAFAQLRPLKRRRNRRYYSPEDVLLVRRLHTLIHVQGHSLANARELLEATPAATPAPDTTDAPAQHAPAVTTTPPAPTPAPTAPPTAATSAPATVPGDAPTPAPTSASAVPGQAAASPDWAWVAQELQEIRKLLSPLP